MLGAFTTSRLIDWVQNNFSSSNVQWQSPNLSAPVNIFQAWMPPTRLQKYHIYFLEMSLGLALVRGGQRYKGQQTLFSFQWKIVIWSEAFIITASARINSEIGLSFVFSLFAF